MTVTVIKWTIDEYHRMIAAGILGDRCVELLKGEIVEMSPEGEPHAYFSSEAGEYLIYLLGNRAKVRQAKPKQKSPIETHRGVLQSLSV